MPKEDKDELYQAVQTGVSDNVNKVLRKNTYTPETKKARRSAVYCAEKNFATCLKMLLDWGVSLEATNDIDGEGGATCLHAAAKRAARDTTVLLLDRNANLNAKQNEGYTPIQCAIAQANKEATAGMASPKHMEVIKELLRRGAKVTSSDHAVGLAAAMREVQFEDLTDSLREAAKRPVTVEDLAKAEGAVWEAMRNHLELVEQREHAKAGQLLIDYESESKVEMKEAQRSKDNAAQLQLDLNERKMLLEGAQKELESVNKDLAGYRETEHDLRLKFDAIAAELKERQADLKSAQAELAQNKAAKEGAQDARAEAEARHMEVESEVEESRARADEIKAEVAAARGELRGWLKDKEAAQRFTQQAAHTLSK